MRPLAVGGDAADAGVDGFELAGGFVPKVLVATDPFLRVFGGFGLDLSGTLLLLERHRDESAAGL